VKKTVFAILILCLAVGLPLMALDLQQRGLNKFRVPQRFAKITVDLNTHDRTDELLLERQLSEPAKVEIMMQSDSAALKQVRFVAESEILGLGQPELEFMVGQVTGTASMASTTVLPAGRYAIYLTSHKHAGQLVIGYQEHPIDPAEFVRLSRIHQGDLNNPPSGYTEVFSADLTGLEVQNQVIYSLSVKNSETIGISVYTSAKQGMVSVDMAGGTSNWTSLVSTEHRICDQMEVSPPAGEYQIKLTCADADGQLYVFVKRNGEGR
jgi:hypothetical protein